MFEDNFLLKAIKEIEDAEQKIIGELLDRTLLGSHSNEQFVKDYALNIGRLEGLQLAKNILTLSTKEEDEENVEIM